MGLLSGLLGNASEVDIEEIREQMGAIMASNETIHLAYKEIRDMYIFTNKRLILIDKQGMTGRKVEYHSIPYKSITHFAVETAGHFDLDAELKIWISGTPEPTVKELKGGTDVVGIQQTLAEHMFS